MKITKRQLRRLIRESCGLAPAPEAPMQPPEVPLQMELPAAPPTAEVPVPEDYEAVRDLLDQNQDIVDLAINAVMDIAGTNCERSSAQAIIDHLEDMLTAPAIPEPTVAPAPFGGTGMIKGPGFM